MPSLVFMLWRQDPLHQIKDLNLEENGLGGVKWKWAVQTGEPSRPCERGESSAIGGAVNLTRAAYRENTVPLDPMSSYSKVRSQQIPA